jgi:UDP-N-acetylglucosamine 2-epimerase (non-hydrolysing)
MRPLRIVHVVGARPNFMKIAPVLAACRERPGLESFLVHTGQHYDERMSRLFFDELAIPRPDVDLEVGSASHARQTAMIMERFEPVLLDRKPGLVLVVGDVNSTVACSLTAAKLGIAVAHVEAGLRSFDRSMPEEINRVVTDSISDLLFVSEPSGEENLRREGVAPEKVHLVGNVMIDTLLAHREKAMTSAILEELSLDSSGYGVLTLHRPANVDDPSALKEILDPIEEMSSSIPVVFPVHPRSREALARAGWTGGRGVRAIEPLGYLDFLRLMMGARIVLTDSGGIQEETTILGVPCVTLRENTERPITVTEGTNRLAGTKSRGIRDAIAAALRGGRGDLAPPRLWDGKAAVRIAEILARRATP